jgi:hypothetical protein
MMVMVVVCDDGGSVCADDGSGVCDDDGGSNVHDDSGGGVRNDDDHHDGGDGLQVSVGCAW